MSGELKKKLKSFDYILVFTPIVLSLFGVIMVYSASMIWAVMEIEGSTDLFYKKQLQWFILSVMIYIFIIFVPYRHYLKIVKLIFVGSPLILILTMTAGRTAGNAQSWISFGSIGFQPAEFIKLGLIIYLAAVYSRKQAYINNFGLAFGPPLIFTFGIFFLIFLQPDLGTGLIILAIAFFITICSGLKKTYMLRIIVIGLIGVFIMYPFLSDEQKSRFTAAYDPFSEEQVEDGGYQLVNSYLAIASGGLTGRGLGESIQKFGYLPEPHTDFIMAIVAEELGVFGVLFVFLCLIIIVTKTFQVAMRSNDPFASLLSIGIGSMICIQSFINLGALTGLLPITGVTLPFVSYGGSSLLILMISLGIINNIAMNLRLKKNLLLARDNQE